MKTYGGVDVKIHVLLTSALVGGEWSASSPGRFTPGERDPGTQWIGGWVCHRSGLDYLERRKILPLPELELRPLGNPSRSQSLYKVRCRRLPRCVITILLYREKCLLECRCKHLKRSNSYSLFLELYSFAVINTVLSMRNT
jgi:hypothetical protein